MDNSDESSLSSDHEDPKKKPVRNVKKRKNSNQRKSLKKRKTKLVSLKRRLMNNSKTENTIGDSHKRRLQANNAGSPKKRKKVVKSN